MQVGNNGRTRSPLRQSARFHIRRHLVEKSFTTSRSLTNQSSREAIDEREREKHVYVRVANRWTASCVHFFGARLLSAPRPSDSLSINDLPFHSLLHWRARKICNAQKAPLVLIIHSRDCVASLTRTDNFFLLRLWSLRSLHACRCCCETAARCHGAF